MSYHLMMLGRVDVGTPRLGYPFLLRLGKSFVVILDYVLAA